MLEVLRCMRFDVRCGTIKGAVCAVHGAVELWESTCLLLISICIPCECTFLSAHKAGNIEAAYFEEEDGFKTSAEKSSK